MSIPTPFNPLGTLGGVTLLNSVHVSCAVDEPYENLVETAFGGNYYLEPFGSSGYFAEVTVENVSGMNVTRRWTLVSVGNYSDTQIGSLVFYSWGAIADMLQAHPQCYDAGSVLPGKHYTEFLLFYNKQGRLNNFNLHHKVENSIYSGEAAGYTISAGLGTWTAEQNVSTQIYISKIPGLSYDFKKLAAHTENVKLDALPARKNGKDGIAIFINDKLEKFIAV